MIRIVREDVQGIRVIKALSKNDYEHRRYDAANKVLVGDEKRAGTVMSIVNPVMTLLMNVGIVAVVALSASRVANHLSDPETVIAFMQYFTLISMAMMSVTRIFVMQTKCAASAKRIGEVLAVGEDMALQSEEAFPNAETDAHIVFDRVSFSYKGAGNDLTDISFAVPRGGSLGIIGATGSGKSTVVRLLQRFYDVGAGSVRITDGTSAQSRAKRFPPWFGAASRRISCIPIRLRKHSLRPRADARTDRRSGQDRAGRRLHHRVPRGLRPPALAEGHQRFRRPEAAHPHRARLGGAAGNPRAGRQLVRARLQDRRLPAPRACGKDAGDDHRHRRAARQLG